MCVHQNAQHRELKVPESTRFVLNTALMVGASTCGLTGVSPPSLSSRNVQKNPPQAIGPEMKHKPRVLRWARIMRARRESRVKLNGYKVAAKSLRSCVYAGTHSTVS